MRPVDVDVKGKNVLIVDDIISTGGTMVRAAELLRKLGGAKKIYVSATHGVFAEGAIERVSSAVDELAVTNTIPTPVSRISIVPELVKLG